MPHVLQEHFKGVVGQYDGPDGDRFALEELAPVARRFVPANARILEIGCGYGRNVSALTTIGARLVVGSDPQFKELLRSRERHRDLPESRRSQIAYVHQEEFRLPFADQAFDLVVLWQVMEHVFGRDEKRRVLNEVVRVVRGGAHPDRDAQPVVPGRLP